MATLIVTENINSVNIEEKTTYVELASIGIQGSAGYPTPLEQNKILTNDGANVIWTDTPEDLNLNGGYF